MMHTYVHVAEDLVFKKLQCPVNVVHPTLASHLSGFMYSFQKMDKSKITDKNFHPKKTKYSVERSDKYDRDYYCKSTSSYHSKYSSNNHPSRSSNSSHNSRNYSSETKSSSGKMKERSTTKSILEKFDSFKTKTRTIGRVKAAEVKKSPLKKKEPSGVLNIRAKVTKALEVQKFHKKKEQCKNVTASELNPNALPVRFMLKPKTNLKSVSKDKNVAVIKADSSPKKSPKSLDYEDLISHKRKKKYKILPTKQIEQSNKYNEKVSGVASSSVGLSTYKNDLTVLKLSDVEISHVKTYKYAAKKREWLSSSKKNEWGDFKTPTVIKENEDNCRLVNVNEDESPPDVEMLDVSFDVPCLEDFREPMQLDENVYWGPDLKPYCIVVDTNILIEDLKFVDVLKSTTFSDMGQPVIYIPWVVLQELDKLKGVTEKPNLRSKASDAIRFLFFCLKSKDPHVCGQTTQMAADCKRISPSSSNDDQVLTCCLKLIEKASREKVMLLTDDKNLCNKALVNDVTVNTLKTLKNIVEKGMNTSYAGPSTSAPFENSAVRLNVSKELTDINHEVKILLRQLLEKIFVQRMNRTFGREWKTSLPIQPPWSLTDIVFCIKQHWGNTFSSILSQDILCHIEAMWSEFQKAKGVPYLHDIVASIISLEAVCHELQNQLTEFDSFLRKISVLKCRCETLGLNHSNLLQRHENIPKSNPVPNNCQEAAIIVFQYLWNVINNLSGMILDYYGWQHNFVYEKPARLLEESEMAELIPEFYANLYQLWKRMRSVLDDRFLADVKNIKGLYGILTSFLRKLKIEVCPPPLDSFSPSSLKALFLDESKRMLLENGYVQLRNFYSVLGECMAKHASKCNQKKSRINT